MKICIIGAGTIGKGMAARLEKEHTVYLQDRTNLKDLKKRLADSDVIIIAVKPHSLHALEQEMGEIEGNKILISVLTGVTHKTLKDYFPHVPSVRVMPNLALTTGKAVLGVAENAESAVLKSQLEALFKPLGNCYWIPEEKFDSLTSLTGSGPAFVLVMIEAMVEAGISLGFSHRESLELILQMMEGTISLLREGKHPGEIKWQIATPGGTTIEGLKALEDKGLRSAVLAAFQAAAEKAKKIRG